MFRLNPVYDEFIDRVAETSRISWHYPGNDSFEKVQCMYHLLLDRDYRNPDIVSDLFYPFMNIFKDVCKQNNIMADKVFGAALHQTMGTSTDHQKFHIDFPFRHHVLIMYLNDNFDKGDTLISDEIYNGTDIVRSDDLQYTRIKARKYHAYMFDGLTYHAGQYPGPGQRRVVCIFAFTLSHTSHAHACTEPHPKTPS
jgi:hypothetical protein